MRREVESLLEFQEKTNGFMEAPAFDVVVEMIRQSSDESLNDPVGRPFAHYYVVERLGSGGMGVVYKARDEHLQRFVALKILPESFTADPERLQRFEREARSASALNHPNVVTIYDVGQVDSTPYITMEFVQGSTLRHLLANGALPTATVLRLAEQLASGLAKIHTCGLIHADLKPENVMITEDGLAKILDFGLAKPAPIIDGPSQPEVTHTTSSGLAGTLSYLSPEQILGRTRDFRADQFSFGCILYEIATGRPAFKRETAAQTFEAITDFATESIENLRPDVPKKFCRIVERCLAKEPEGRYRSTPELAHDFQELREAQTAPATSLSRTVRLFAAMIVAVLVLAIGISFRPLLDRLFENAAGSIKVASLAVLPLENLSGGEDGQVFADGMTEELITEIGRVNGLQVKSRTTMMRYRNSRKTVPEIARELSVDAVLEASVWQSGQTMRVNAKLIEAADRIRWTREYEKDLQDVLTLQREIARDIAQAINLHLTPHDERRINREEKVDVQAQRYYWLGLNELNKRTAAGMKRSSEYFSEAIDRDPNYAPAYAALSNSYIVQTFQGMLLPSEGYPAARDAAILAINLDPTVAEAHAALGRIRTSYERDWAGAETEFKTAMELNKNSELVYQWYSQLLMATGRLQDAIAMGQRAIGQDPQSPAAHVGLGWLLYFAQMYPEAIEEFKFALALDPGFPLAMSTLADAYDAVGRADDAFEWRQKQLEIEGVIKRDLIKLDGAYKAGGTHGYWQQRLKMEITDQKQTGEEWTYFMAVFYARVGDREQALNWLEKAYNEGHDRLIYLKVEPVFERLRSDARFVNLIKRLGLP